MIGNQLTYSLVMQILMDNEINTKKLQVLNSNVPSHIQNIILSSYIGYFTLDFFPYIQTNMFEIMNGEGEP